MNIDQLIRMANQISSFFETESPPGRAPADVAIHLRRYWEPRMRAQIVTYYEERQGAGLGEIALGAVGQLAAEASHALPGGGARPVPPTTAGS